MEEKKDSKVISQESPTFSMTKAGSKAYVADEVIFKWQLFRVSTAEFIPKHGNRQE
jgi:hypothetical protein